METFAERLNLLMEKRGLTNYRVAKDIGVTEGTLRAWRRIDGSEPRKKNIENLSAYFGVHPVWFKFGDKERPPVLRKDVLDIATQIDDYLRHHPKSIGKIKKMVDLIIHDD